MKLFRIGIIATGWIAEKAAITLNGLADCVPYAVGSRTLEKAQAFAEKWNIPKAYGSYSELIADPDIRCDEGGNIGRKALFGGESLHGKLPSVKRNHRIGP